MSTAKDTPSQFSADVLIVGAGLSGLMAAHALCKRGQRVILLDKGRSVGGRLATRRIGPGRADTGAQFFTVRDNRFQAFVDDWLGRGLVFQWSRGWHRGSSAGHDAEAGRNGYPRYAVHGGFNALAKQMATEVAASGVQIVVNTRVRSVQADTTSWRTHDAAGTIYRSEKLILTAPVPQSLALLDAGNTVLDANDRAALERIVYAPCLCGLFWLEGDVSLPAPGAVQEPDAPISWMADNRRKGISPEATLVTIHAGPDYSRQQYGAADEKILLDMWDRLRPFLDSGAMTRAAELKRWRYAQPQVLHPEPYLMAQGVPRLLFGGDAFGGPRVEGASLSGLAMGNMA